MAGVGRNLWLTATLLVLLALAAVLLRSTLWTCALAALLGLPDGTRITPPAPPGADLYLFVGDSFMFGQGLEDNQNLSAQFARANDLKVRTVNFSAPGYGPNHLVRAFEAGFFDRFVGQKVKAV